MNNEQDLSTELCLNPMLIWKLSLSCLSPRPQWRQLRGKASSHYIRCCHQRQHGWPSDSRQWDEPNHKFISTFTPTWFNIFISRCMSRKYKIIPEYCFYQNYDLVENNVVIFIKWPACFHHHALSCIEWICLNPGLLIKKDGELTGWLAKFLIGLEEEHMSPKILKNRWL